MERGALSCASAWIHDAPFSHRSSFSRFLRCVRFISREPGVVGASDIKRSDSCAPARRRSILQKVCVDGAQTLPVSLLLAAGAPITYVSAQPGHANPATTLRYLRAITTRDGSRAAGGAGWTCWTASRMRWRPQRRRVPARLGPDLEPTGPEKPNLPLRSIRSARFGSWAVKDSNLARAD